MKLFLLITSSDGTIQKVPAVSGLVHRPLQPGEQLLIVDETGARVEGASLRKGVDLVIEVEGEDDAIVLDYYKGAGDGEIQQQSLPVSLGGEVDPPANRSGDSEGARHSGAAMPEDDFSLIHYSNTQYTEFGEPRSGSLPFLRAGGASGEEASSRNLPPLAYPDEGIVEENGALTMNLLSNDRDPEGGLLTLRSIEGKSVVEGTTLVLPNGSSILVQQGGNILYTPGSVFESLAEGENQIDTFVYTVADRDGNESMATVTVTILGRNDAPIAENDHYTVPEKVAPILDLLSNDFDVDAADSLSISGFVVAGNFVVPQIDVPILLDSGATVVLLSDGTVQYFPAHPGDSLAEGETLIEQFVYQIDDGNNGTDTATVTITIVGQNDPPVAIDDAVATAENAAVTVAVLANDNDPDGDTLIITAITQPLHGSASFTATSVTFDPGTAFDYLAVGETTVETFTYTVSDGKGGFDTAQVLVTIHGQNDGPMAVDDAVSTTENEAVTIASLANDSDPDGDTLTITGITQPLQGSARFTGTSVTFDPGTAFDYLAVGETAAETFTYTISDGNGGTDTATVFVTINGVNDAPVARDDVFVSPDPMGSPITLNVLANDTDIDGTLNPATVDLDPSTPGIQTIYTVPGNGVWTTDGAGNVTFIPEPGLVVQPTPISYTVSDDIGTASPAAKLSFLYSAADVWFGNDESGSVDSADFNQSRALISGTANLMDFGSNNVGFNVALFTWAGSKDQLMELGLTENKSSFVNASASYSRNYGGSTDIGAGIVFGTNQILASASARQLAGHPRADVPQVMVILTDATPNQILNDASLLADAQAAKDAGITLVIVAIQEAQQDPIAVARLQAAASLDVNGDSLVVTADSYASISVVEMADLLQTIREGAAASLTLTTPPIVIDMDGDGVEFDSIPNGINFDVDGDGQREHTAWAHEDDAVLIFDANNNGEVDGRAEFAFADYSSNPNATDLEGLREGFDSNKDGILSADDEGWSLFKLWQDVDGDGRVGQGEMISLDEANIKSISLVSDGKSYTTADGDVFVHGTSQVIYHDGSTGSAADAAFSYREMAVTEDEELLSLLSYHQGQGESLIPNEGGFDVAELIDDDLREEIAEIETEEGQVLDISEVPAPRLTDGNWFGELTAAPPLEGWGGEKDLMS